MIGQRTAVSLLLSAFSLLICTEVFSQVPTQIALENLETASRPRGIVENYPVTVGVILPRGALNIGERVRLIDELKNEIPVRAENTGYWDISRTQIKWILLHFNASSNHQYTLLLRQPITDKLIAQNLMATETDSEFQIDTGVLKAVIRKDAGSTHLFDRIIIDGKDILQTPLSTKQNNNSNAQLFSIETIDENGVPHPGGALPLTQWEISVEENYSDSLILHATGFFTAPDGAKIAKISQRYFFFRNEQFVRLSQTLTWLVDDCSINSEYNFSCATRIRNYALRLKPTTSGNRSISFGVRGGKEEVRSVSFPEGPASLTLIQANADRFNVGGTLSKGLKGLSNKEQIGRIDGWIGHGSEDGGVAVSVKNFWQRYPSAFSLSNGYLDIELWSSRTGKSMGFGDLDFWLQNGQYILG